METSLSFIPVGPFFLLFLHYQVFLAGNHTPSLLQSVENRLEISRDKGRDAEFARVLLCCSTSSILEWGRALALSWGGGKSFGAVIQTRNNIRGNPLKDLERVARVRVWHCLLFPTERSWEPADTTLKSQYRVWAPSHSSYIPKSTKTSWSFRSVGSVSAPW